VFTYDTYPGFCYLTHSQEFESFHVIQTDSNSSGEQSSLYHHISLLRCLSVCCWTEHSLCEGVSRRQRGGLTGINVLFHRRHAVLGQSCARILSCKFTDLEGCARAKTMEGKFPFGQGFMMPSNFSFAVAAFNPMPLQDRSQSVAQPVGMDPLMPSMLVSRSTRWSHEEVCL
jgi:hypothetical protein